MNNQRNRLPPAHRLRRCSARAPRRRARPGRGKADASPASSWKFVVGGDSRNCGDVIMPVVAAGANSAGASFLLAPRGLPGALHDFDEDLPRRSARSPARSRWRSSTTSAARGTTSSRASSLPFGSIPVYPAIGKPRARRSQVAPGKFLSAVRGLVQCPADPRAQRLKDNPKGPPAEVVHHWIQNGVDFISARQRLQRPAFDDGSSPGSRGSSAARPPTLPSLRDRRGDARGASRAAWPPTTA